MLSDELVVGTTRLQQGSDEWVVKCSSLVYDVYGAAKSADGARTALGLNSMAQQDPRNVNITGGYGAFDVLRVDRTPKEPTDAVPLAFAQSALFTSGLPFTDAGDLLVYQSPGYPYVVHRGTEGQVFVRTLQWIDAPNVPTESPLPDNVIGTPLTVAVGPIPHPAPHDQWFPTVEAFSNWASGKYLLATLTVLPNGINALDNSVLTLPTMPEGATVVFGDPVDFTAAPDGSPIAALTLQARGATIQAAKLSLFSAFDVVDSVLEIQNLRVPVTDAGDTRILFGYGTKADIGILEFAEGGGTPSVNWEIRGSEVDIETLKFALLAGHQMRLRLLDSDVRVSILTEPFGDALGRMRVDQVNSSLVFRNRIQLYTGRVGFGALNSFLKMNAGVDGNGSQGVGLSFAALSNSDLLGTGFDLNSTANFSIGAGSVAKICASAIEMPNDVIPEMMLFGVADLATTGGGEFRTFTGERSAIYYSSERNSLNLAVPFGATLRVVDHSLDAAPNN